MHERFRKILEDALAQDRSCAELMHRVVCVSQNLLSDSVGFLLLAFSNLRQTDKLPSLEPIELWRALPPPSPAPLEADEDEALQRDTAEVWRTHCGMMVEALIRSPWYVQTFAGKNHSQNADMQIED